MNSFVFANSPALPLPQPFCGNEKGTFAENTVRVRLPDIARRMLKENTFSPDIVQRVEALIAGLPDEPLRYLTDPAAQTWQPYIQPYLGWNWLDIPWYFAEAYFYRRVLEATRYFEPGPTHLLDPYRVQKQLGLVTSASRIEPLLAQISEWQNLGLPLPEQLARLLQINLWGNAADLSIWPAGAAAPAHTSHRDLLIDDTPLLLKQVFDAPLRRIDFLIDNAGFELVCDLVLAEFFLSHQLAQEVVFHLKEYPVFVSDALVKDVEATLSALCQMPGPAAQTAGENLARYQKTGAFRLRPDFFWVSPCAFWQLPPALQQEFSSSQCILSKGDANYRRWMGDRHWEETLSFAQIVTYCPIPVFALRVAKSDMMVGLAPGTAASLDLSHPGWRSNGQTGMIQSNLT